MSTDPKYAHRWEDGIPHHPRSIALMEHMKKVDKENGGGMYDSLKTGGDGDMGEEIMYLMDGYHENESVMPKHGGQGQGVCCDCGANLFVEVVYYGAGDGTRTGHDGFFRCESCHRLSLASGRSP